LFNLVVKTSTFVLIYIIFAIFEQNICAAQTLSADSTEQPASKAPEENPDWADDAHKKLSDSVNRSALWFDRFFTDDKLQLEPAKASARIMLGWEPRKYDFAEFSGRFRLNVKLPHFSNKVDLILSDDNDDDLELLPFESIKNEKINEEDSFAAAIRVINHNRVDKFFETRLGVSSSDVFIRAKHRKYFLFSNHFVRVEPSIYYYINDGLGGRLFLEYTYQKSDVEQIRLNYSIRGSESFKGIRWKHGVYHLKQWSAKQASIISAQIEGERAGENGYIVDNTIVSYRYRFNAYKKWLYFEIEPFVEWPLENNHDTTPGIALRVEGFFYKN